MVKLITFDVYFVRGRTLGGLEMWKFDLKLTVTHLDVGGCPSRSTT